MKQQQSTNVKKERTKQEQERHDRKKLGWILISITLLIILFLPGIIYPMFYASQFTQTELQRDITSFPLRSSINATRWLMLSAFSFYLGTKYLFEDKKHLIDSKEQDQ